MSLVVILLTKYEQSRSLAYKVSIKSCDYEKAQNPEVWPYRVGVRLFKYFKSRNENRNIDVTERKDRSGIINFRKQRKVHFNDQDIYQENYV